MEPRNEHRMGTLARQVVARRLENRLRQLTPVTSAPAPSTIKTNVAYFLAECSENAYENAATLSTLYTGSQNPWTFEPDNFFDVDAVQAFLIYSADTREVVLSFRGSCIPFGPDERYACYQDEWKDVLRDIDGALVPVPFSSATPSILVGRGFLDAWNVLKTKSDLLTRLGTVISQLGGVSGIRLYLTGHSLGAAIAALAFYDLAPSYKGALITHCTFAAPLVGNQDFATSFDALVASSSDLSSASYIDPQDALMTWANYFMSLGFNGKYTPYVGTSGLQVLQPGNGHGVTNYKALLEAAAPDLPPVIVPTTSDESAIPANPSQKSLLGVTSSRLVVRVTTSDTYKAETNSTVYFVYNAHSDGTGGIYLELTNGNNEPPFQRGQVDTFTFTFRDWKPSDLARCKLERSNKGDGSDWEVAGIELILDGAQTISLNDVDAVLDDDNPRYLFSGLAENLLAVGIDWQGSEQYDTSGNAPSVTLCGDGRLVEVHKGAHSDKLYYRGGRMDAQLNVTWDKSSHEYDTSGKNPSVAVNAAGQLVEVHKGANSEKLYYRCGQLNDDLTVTWAKSSHEYDTSGNHPRVALRGRDVVEVHKGSNSDKLYYRCGRLNDDFTISWDKSSHEYDTSGKNPSVALTEDRRVLEVHKGANSDKLYYRMGQLNDNLTISWDKSSHEYDTSGETPTVAVDSYGRVVEVHKGANSNKLYYRPGTTFSGLTVDWDVSSHEYDSSGIGPVVAVNDRAQVISVHKAASTDELRDQPGAWISDPYSIKTL